MPDLRWRVHGSGILPPGSWKPGKDVVLGSDEFAEPPNYFTIYRRPGAVQRRFREKKGKPGVIQIDRLKAGIDHAAARSEPWRLPTPPGARIRWRAFFEDDQLNRSPIINISRLGKIIPNAGASVRIPHVPVAEGTLGIGFEITASVDPLVELSVLTPWGDGGAESLDEYLYELAQDSLDEDDDPAATLDELVSYLAPHLPNRAPEGWEFRVPDPQRDIPEGEPVEMLVELQAPTRASCAFAIQMRAVDHPDLMAASDLLVVEVPEDRADARLLFGGGSGEGGAEEYTGLVEHGEASSSYSYTGLSDVAASEASH